MGPNTENFACLFSPLGENEPHQLLTEYLDSFALIYTNILMNVYGEIATIGINDLVNLVCIKYVTNHYVGALTWELVEIKVVINS